MKRASSPPDPKPRSTPPRDDWTYLRVKLTRQEQDGLEQVARRLEMSPSELLRYWVRGANRAAVPSDGERDGESDASTQSKAEGIQGRGVSMSRSSQAASRAARSTHESHVEASRVQPAEDLATAEAAETLDDYIEANREILEAVVLNRLMELISSDMLVPKATFLARSEWTKEALRRAEKASRIFHIAVGRLWLYPTFFLDPRYDRKALQSVCKVLGDLSAGSKWMFFTTTKASLALPAKRGQRNGTPRTPLQALAAGDVEAVMAAAREFRER